MATVEPRHKKVFPERVPRTGVTLWRQLAPILKRLATAAGFKLSFEGIEAQETADGGIHLKAIVANDPAVPFNVSAAGIITSGTYEGSIPTLDGISLALSTAPALTIPASGPYFVYVRAQYTLTASASSFTYAATRTGLIIHTTTSEISTPGGPSADFFYFMIAAFSEGLKTFQRTGGDMDTRIDGGSSAKATIALV